MIRIKQQILLFICICTSIRAKEIPDCDYFDTVDLTGVEKLSNGSYKYDGLLIPPEQTGTYNYKIFFEGTPTAVEEHVRGCVCKIKPCIRYCCHRHRIDPNDEGNCKEELGETQVNITLEGGTQQESDIRNQFVVQPGIRVQCNQNNHIGPFTQNDDWKLFENGTLYRSNDDVYLSKRDYCIQPKELADLGLNYMLLPMNCLNEYDFVYVNLGSIFFLLLTICIYIFVLKLQHIHDKCYLSYLICLSVSLLINIVTKVETSYFGPICYLVAYVGYFSSISIYLWLAVMAFDLWRILVNNMFVMIQNDFRKRFWIYSLFVWGTASVFLLITILADHLLDNLDIDSNLKMGYAYYECFGKVTDWSSVVYFFAPAAILVSINVIFIFITLWRVHMENKKNREQLKELGQRNKKNNIRLIFYLRFFAIAFMDWLIELTAVVYILAGDPPQFLQYIMFYLGLIHCFLIFAITISRKDVVQLLIRWTPQMKSQSVTQNSLSTSINLQKVTKN
ncbi:probable G-protein coupled receptor Mth-like 11 [Drosophila innubila]|uniref:probable G-protein coupled receptor Mth-like 11 n=1 Tax=Drosophila innubila TaxID=198719 RepID=UPI00148D5EB2|nr:probable G-protein coupled receptor Mth-like 11 [Drosophila innubila]